MAVHLSGAIKQPLKLSIEEAIERLKQGGVVAIPTETVYGLAADASQPKAVARIFTINDYRSKMYKLSFLKSDPSDCSRCPERNCIR
ncbi:MAG: Sua5/YciO/YrdC/YwlC family protein [Gammaproteobacteria bacterium]|nr:Sua5/YciO/YrdC/YwlC family protein [Gammaproteobacteria bacterium]